jgi:hypothetical protein
MARKLRVEMRCENDNMRSCRPDAFLILVAIDWTGLVWTRVQAVKRANQIEGEVLYTFEFTFKKNFAFLQRPSTESPSSFALME